MPNISYHERDSGLRQKSAIKCGGAYSYLLAVITCSSLGGSTKHLADNATPSGVPTREKRRIAWYTISLIWLNGHSDLWVIVGLAPQHIFHLAPKGVSGSCEPRVLVNSRSPHIFFSQGSTSQEITHATKPVDRLYQIRCQVLSVVLAPFLTNQFAQIP